jgi:hypothetical protein
MVKTDGNPAIVAALNDFAAFSLQRGLDIRCESAGNQNDPITNLNPASNRDFSPGWRAVTMCFFDPRRALEESILLDRCRSRSEDRSASKASRNESRSLSLMLRQRVNSGTNWWLVAART